MQGRRGLAAYLVQVIIAKGTTDRRKAWANAWNACLRLKAADNETQVWQDSDRRDGFVQVLSGDGRRMNASYQVSLHAFSYLAITQSKDGVLLIAEFARGETPNLVHRTLHHGQYFLEGTNDYRGTIATTEGLASTGDEAMLLEVSADDAAYHAQLINGFFWDAYANGRHAMWQTTTMFDARS